jgi:predicted nuclease of restriction endonuclease-like (RecB) superfamily
VRSVNSAHVAANWLIGQQIVEAEQGGTDRAAYGTRLLETLSAQLASEYGSGFSVSAPRYMRQFYTEYPDLLQIHHAVRDESAHGAESSQMLESALRSASDGGAGPDWKPGHLHLALSWTHYRVLLKVTRPPVRDFYEIEATRNAWSARQLERQINSLLFERLLKSRDKDGVLALANEGLVLTAPVDVIKDPYVLEFLNLPESHRLVESQLEEALITHLQESCWSLGAASPSSDVRCA